MARRPFILFFIGGTNPTAEEQDAAELLAPMRVGFRNVTLVADRGAIEICDGVAGLVPPQYAKARPTAKAAREAYDGVRKAKQKDAASRLSAAKKKAADTVAREADKELANKDKAKADADKAVDKAKADKDKADANKAVKDEAAKAANVKRSDDWTPNA